MKIISAQNKQGPLNSAVAAMLAKRYFQNGNEVLIVDCFDNKEMKFIYSGLNYIKEDNKDD